MKSIILILLTTLSLSLTAQEKMGKKAHWDKMKDYKPLMIKTIGVSFQKFDGLNSRIAAFPQYKRLDDDIYTISLGSMHEMKNFITQMNVSAGSTLTGDPDERSSAVRMLGGSFDLGYDVIPAARVMLYPMAGVGIETYHALFYKDVNAVSFNDVANSSTTQNNIRSVKFTNNFATYRFGLGFALKAPGGNHSIGLQSTYSRGFKGDKAWKSAENQSLSGAPVDDLERFSLSLVITGSMMGMGKK